MLSASHQASDAPLALSSRAAARADGVLEGATTAVAASVPVLLGAIVLLLLVDAWPALQRVGLAFLTDSTWDPVRERFGAAAYVFGTVVTSLLALLLAAPIGVGCALFIAEYAPWVFEDRCRS